MSVKQANEMQKVVDEMRAGGLSDPAIEFHLKTLFSKIIKNIAPVKMVAKKSVVHDAQKKRKGSD